MQLLAVSSQFIEVERTAKAKRTRFGEVNKELGLSKDELKAEG
jgi:hypothetical protein